MASIFPFLGTAALATVLLKLELEKNGNKRECKVPASKHDVRALREKHFSKSVSVSYSNSEPLMFVKGDGSRLIDESGISYLDTRNNVSHCGHSNPRVATAVQQQVMQFNSNTRYLHPNVAHLAQRLSSLLPDSLEIVFFCNSGSEANDLALRLARAYSNSPNTIVVDGAYHGHTLAVLECSPYKYEYSKEFDLKAPKDSVDFKSPGKHIWKVPAPDTYRGPHRDVKDAGIKYAAKVAEACDFYQYTCGESVGAFIIEGGIGVGGAILPPPNYLPRSVKAVRNAGGVYIADEVQTGFGRYGSSFWAFQHTWTEDEDPVVPDIVTVGKPFGNGMPLAAVVTTRKIASAFEKMGVDYFNTFGGNPVCAAAGLAVLDVIESDNLQQRAHEVGGYMMTRFVELQTRLDIIGDVRGSGLFIGIELVRDRKTLEAASTETSFISTTLKKKYHILTSIDGLLENVLIVKPPMVFSKADADYFVECFEKVVLEDLAKIGDLSFLGRTPT